MMIRPAIAVILCLSMASPSIASAFPEYGEYQDAVSRSDELGGRRLIRLSYIGSVQGGEWLVFDVLSVVEGMAAPRGERQLIVAKLDDSQLNIIFDMLIAESALTAPLWCAEDKIFLHGRTSNIPRLTGGAHYNGNCIEIIEEEGEARFELLDIYAYGSSGGIADEVPDEEQREREKREWDEK